MIISTVTLPNTSAAILYLMLAVALWHMIGIPPIVEWTPAGRRRRRERLTAVLTDTLDQMERGHMGTRFDPKRLAQELAPLLDSKGVRISG